MSSKEPQRSAPKRILIVEDNELNMKLLNDVLEAYGYDVIKTAGGAAVLELAPPAWARPDPDRHPASGHLWARGRAAAQRARANQSHSGHCRYCLCDGRRRAPRARQRLRRLYRQTDYAARVSPDRRRLPWPRAGKS